MNAPAMSHRRPVGDRDSREGSVDNGGGGGWGGRGRRTIAGTGAAKGKRTLPDPTLC